MYSVSPSSGLMNTLFNNSSSVSAAMANISSPAQKISAPAQASNLLKMPTPFVAIIQQSFSIFKLIMISLLRRSAKISSLWENSLPCYNSQEGWLSPLLMHLFVLLRSFQRKGPRSCRRPFGILLLP